VIVLDTDVLSELTRQYPDQGAIVAADCDRVGRPIGVADAQIASVCRKLQAALATRKIRDLEQAGLELVDPWHIH
jgi:predicted nucleic acid-binding protein